MELDLSELAALKLKVDIYTELLEKKMNEVKAKMKDAKSEEVLDSANNLILKAVSTDVRDFNVALVKERLGPTVLEEKVDPKRFDKATKDFSEKELSSLYSVTQRVQMRWSGLDVYKAKLQAAGK